MGTEVYGEMDRDCIAIHPSLAMLVLPVHCSPELTYFGQEPTITSEKPGEGP